MATGGCVPSVISFNILIDGFARAGQLTNAEALVHQMASCSPPVEADCYTLNALLRACFVRPARHALACAHAHRSWRFARPAISSSHPPAPS